MAWNPSPEVKVARDAATKLGADRVVVLYTTATGQIGYASYGVNREQCASARKLADELYDAAMNHFEQGNDL